MQILAHRGCWDGNIKCNSLQALVAALENGYGFESDVRDYKGNLVISHDIADSSCCEADEVFSLLSKYNNQRCFAINVKADGLKKMIKTYIDRYNITNYFLFDMSVPQMVEYKEMGLNFFTRQSEIEPDPCLYDFADGVWIDGFWKTDWISESLLKKHITNGKLVCIVSTDLHGKDNHRDFWEKIKSYDIDFSRVMICTDHPYAARKFFEDRL